MTRWRRRLERLRAWADALGWWNTAKILLWGRLWPGNGGLLPIYLGSSPHPIYLRRGTSDIDVFREVFVDDVYAPAYRDADELVTVLDCGANIGLASIYFLRRSPRCRVLAVEPDPKNAAVLRMNLSPYAERARYIRAGVWRQESHLVIRDVPYRDGRAWATQVREAQDGEHATIRGRSVSSLIDELTPGRISLLKMDVEGAEAVIFERKPEWLTRVESIAIELHRDSCFGDGAAAFEKVMREESGWSGHDLPHDNLVFCKAVG